MGHSSLIKLAISLGLFICLPILIAVLLPKSKFSANVIDLIQGDSPEIKILQEIASGHEGKLITLRLYSKNNSPIPSPALSLIKAELSKSSLIEEVSIANADAFTKTGKLLFENRYTWLLPKWLDENIPQWQTQPESISNEEISSLIIYNMEMALNNPQDLGYTETIPHDPFLLVDYLNPGSDLFPQATPQDKEAHLWITQKHSPFSERGQDALFDVINNSIQKIKKQYPYLEGEYSGLSLFAHESKNGLKKELIWFNWLALAIVTAIVFFAARRWTIVFKIAFTLLFSLLSALAMTLICFQQIHILALVIASTLVGIAVDYAFHLILHEPDGLDYKSTQKAVSVGAFSTSIGFLILLFSPLPFLSQVGVFVGTGLIAALLFSLFIGASGGSKTISGKTLYPFNRLNGIIYFMLITLASGTYFLNWEDDINALEYPLPHLKEREQKLRSKSSITDNRAVSIIHDSTLTNALEKLKDLNDAPGVHAGNWISPYSKYRLAHKFFIDRPDFQNVFTKRLESHGYIPESFSPFFNKWESFQKSLDNPDQFENKLTKLTNSLPGASRHFIHKSDSIAWFMVLSENNSLTSNHPESIPLDQGKMLSKTFQTYRTVFIGFGIIGFTLMLIITISLFGWRKGFVTLTIPSLSLITSLGIIGFVTPQVTLFTLIGSILAFCLSFDYSIFAVESFYQQKKLPNSLIVSATSSIAVFGILSFSKVEAVSQLGIIVCLSIFLTLVLISCRWPFRRLIPLQNISSQILPHGKESVQIKETLHFPSENSIETVFIPTKAKHLYPEILLETMAQASAILLSNIGKHHHEKRFGMLITTKSLNTKKTVLQKNESYKIVVTIVFYREKGMVPFSGEAFDSTGNLFLETDFSIYIS